MTKPVSWANSYAIPQKNDFVMKGGPTVFTHIVQKCWY